MAGIVEKFNSWDMFGDQVGVLCFPVLLIFGCAGVLFLLAEYLKRNRSEGKQALGILQVLIVIGAIVVIGWKIYNEFTPSPQEPVKRRMVLLPGEGEMNQPSGKTSPK
ncbi:MAG: hypothetical protein ACRC7D_01685 [Aeromonas popoffii]|uniref:hypothetical protein n=1 Tax=Aeromonas popoffii TaxID=70856 RepID=UPI003F33ACF5